MKCNRCDSSGWVCETHIILTWDGPNACGCGAAGAPCGRCNAPSDGEAPRMPDGFKTIDKDRRLAALRLGTKLPDLD